MLFDLVPETMNHTILDILKNETNDDKKSTWAVFKNKSAHFLLNQGLPNAKTELYKHSQIHHILQARFNEIYPSHDIISGHFEPVIDVSNFSCYQLTFFNGRFIEKYSNFPKNEIEIIQNDEIWNKHSLVIDRFSELSYHNDAFEKLNDALHHHNTLILVKPNITLEKPIYIHHYFSSEKFNTLVCPRIALFVGEQSKISVLEFAKHIGDYEIFVNKVSKTILDINAQCDYIKIQNHDKTYHKIDHSHFELYKNAQFKIWTYTLGGAFIRNNLHIKLSGTEANAELYGYYHGNSDCIFDNHTVVDHEIASAMSKEMYKGILDDKSVGIFNGKIFVRKDAQKTNAFQSNKNILIGDFAKVHTKPQLEIWADDVKCSHGCTVGRLDEEAIFYMQARGLDKIQAKALLLQAFAKEIIFTMEESAIRNFLEELITKKLGSHGG